MADPLCRITFGSSYENRANLASQFLNQIIASQEGTRLGRQEIHGELLEDVPGALWSRGQIEDRRWPGNKPLPHFTRVVVAIDPAVTSGEGSDETGIIVLAKDHNGIGYVLADESGRYQPNAWAQKAIQLYRQYGADRIVAEVNNGGDLVEATIRQFDQNVAFTPVHASRGKARRAEPIAALYEARHDFPLGKVYHVGTFPRLEDQMVELVIDFDPKVAGYSPDRVDALVWGFSDLMVKRMTSSALFEQVRRLSNELDEKRGVANQAARRPWPPDTE